LLILFYQSLRELAFSTKMTSIMTLIFKKISFNSKEIMKQ